MLSPNTSNALVPPMPAGGTPVTTPPVAWSCGHYSIPLGRPVIMGILNVTPDSFSDGGAWLDPASAVARGQALVAEGADILDIGGESTRPGAATPPLAEELRRVIPVIQALAQAVTVPISVDTRHAAVAEAALQAGATIVNDITALRDPAMLAVVRRSRAGVVLMHMLGTPQDMQKAPHYDDVVAEVRAFLAARLAAALAAGIPRQRLVIDPGIGFGKTTRHNLALLGALAQLATLAPVLVGASRKRFIGEITGAPLPERLPGSLTVAIWSLMRGAAILRVHDVAATRAAVTMAGALAGMTHSGSPSSPHLT